MSRLSFQNRRNLFMLFALMLALFVFIGCEQTDALSLYEGCPDEAPQAPEEGGGACLMWDCEVVAEPACWACEFVPAHEGESCEMDSGAMGVCTGGLCQEGEPTPVDGDEDNPSETNEQDLPAEEDDPSEMEMETSEEADTSTEEDLSETGESWEELCEEEEPVPPPMIYDCKLWHCEKIAPPECWDCGFLPDPSQDGENCMNDAGQEGVCIEGECETGSADGDLDSTESETELACIEEGEIGFIFSDNECCEGLTSVASAVIDENGECSYLDCSCFLCVNEGDDICNEAMGENKCNSADCEEEPPRCQTDEDCPHPDCKAGSDGTCLIQYAQCLEGVCHNSTMNYPDARCNESSGHCEGAAECEDFGGFCSHWMQGCPDGYANSQDPEQMGCPGGRSALCCMPQTQDTECERLGGECVFWQSPCPAGTEEADSHYDCSRSEHCCVPVVEPECIADDDCIDLPWFINCLGHWDCERGQCEPVCGEPCGDGICQEQEGESRGNCGSDCASGASDCFFDAQCEGENRCYMLEGGGCFEHRVSCEDYRCLTNESVNEFATCTEDVGRCVNLSGECESSEDCGAPSCHDMDLLGCFQSTWECNEGICENIQDIDRYAQCDSQSGLCESLNSNNPCRDAGGVCQSWSTGCAPGMGAVDLSCGDMMCAGGCLCCMAMP